MMTVAAAVSLVLGLWGVFEISADIHRDRGRVTRATRVADFLWLLGCACIAITAVYALTHLWF